MPQRSAATMLSMSPPLVESSKHAEHGAHALYRHRDRNHELILVVHAHDGNGGSGQGRGDLRVGLAVLAANLRVERQIGLPDMGFDAAPERRERVRILDVRRRQIVTKHLSAREERIGIDDQPAVAVIDARAAARRLHQPPQDGRGALRIDGEFQRAAESVVLARARFELEQTLMIERHLICVECGGSRERARYDLALGEQALHLGVDEPGAELVEIEDARNEDRQPNQVQHDDASREAGEAVPERKVEPELAPRAPRTGEGQAPRPAPFLPKGSGFLFLPGPVRFGGHGISIRYSLNL